MKIILKQTVPSLGKEGQVVTVKSGFARNYLFPRGLAIVADRTQVRALERRHARVEAKLAETQAGAEALKAKIDGKSILIPAKVGRDGTKLFGAITAQDIVDAVKEQLNLALDKKQVALLLPIKRLGDHRIHLDLHRHVDSSIVARVYDPAHGKPVDEVAVAAEPAEEA